MLLNNKSFLVGLTFFVLALVTLSHYGTNWDTINHLPRGQAYLRYFLTGKKDYVGLKKYQPYWQNPESLFIKADIPFKDVPSRSFYQMEDATVKYFISIDGDGHPPLSDTLSAAFNRILFGRLRFINDIDSYRVYGVFLSACLVGLLYHWISQKYGSIAGFFSALALSIYPLFWAESHFNTEKDIPETVFWSFFIYSIWKGVTAKSSKWILFSGLFFGLGLGTKFNILFSIFIIIPWIVFLLIFRQLKLSQTPKIIILGLLAFIIGISILVASWPYLWADPIARIARVLNFYQDIGTGGFDSRFLGPLGVSWYPLLWISYTTPLTLLFLLLSGLFVSIRKIIIQKDSTIFLFLLWLTVPIIRETWPGASFYGGIRQIMEYIPALAVFVGLGAQSISDRFKKPGLIFVTVLFAPIILRLIQIHPNENVYFNPLIGGLSGAKAANLPYWGFSFGAPYRQGVEWLNAHAETGATVVFGYELIPNFPKVWLRPDLDLHNSGRSGYLREGEYAITLTYQGTDTRSYYDSYLEKFLDPVFQVTVDNVAILKIWKNDEAHLKLKWSEQVNPNVKFVRRENRLLFDLGEDRKLSRLEINYKQSNCKPLVNGFVRISKDGAGWARLPGDLPDDWRVAVLGEQPKAGKFIEPFLGQVARFIELTVSPSDTCLKNIQNFKLYYFL